MRRVTILDDRNIYPFNEAARELRVLNKPLKVHQRDLLVSHSDSVVEYKSFDAIPRSDKSEMLARALVSDILVYNREARDKGLIFLNEVGVDPGLDHMSAAIKGAREVAMPVTFSVLTNMVAFLPMMFIPGFMGKVFGQIPVVVISVVAGEGRGRLLGAAAWTLGVGWVREDVDGRDGQWLRARLDLTARYHLGGVVLRDLTAALGRFNLRGLDIGKVFSGQGFTDHHGIRLTQGSGRITRNKGYGENFENGGVSKCQAVFLKGIFFFFKIQIRPRQDPGIFFYFRIFILKCRGQGNLDDGYQVLFFIDVKIALQPVNTFVILIVLVVGQLILNVNKYQNGSCNSHSQAQQIKNRKELVPHGISGQGKKIIFK